MSCREEVDELLAREERENLPMETYHYLARTLATEVDARDKVIAELEAKNDGLQAQIAELVDSPLTWAGQNMIACEKSHEVRELKKRIAELEAQVKQAESVEHHFAVRDARIAELEGDLARVKAEIHGGQAND